MSLSTLLMTALFSVLPISELRGAIPYAVIRGVGILPATLISIFFNALVPFIVYLFLSTFHKLLYKWKTYKSFFDRTVEKTQKKVHEKIEKYGYWGLMIFVAVPLPMTGAWTGTLGAWVLGMDKKKATLATIGGVVIAGIVVGALVGILGTGAKTIFFKSM
ncbi:MAG: small multi-drug export protein [Spirochaetaceae bacterium]|nr:small multi-drug export protein [Spirochaetaceae bacterium]